MVILMLFNTLGDSESLSFKVPFPSISPEH